MFFFFIHLFFSFFDSTPRGNFNLKFEINNSRHRKEILKQHQTTHFINLLLEIFSSLRTKKGSWKRTEKETVREKKNKKMAREEISLCKCHTDCNLTPQKREVLLSLSEVLPRPEDKPKSDKTVVMHLGNSRFQLTNCILISQLNTVFYDFSVASKVLRQVAAYVPPKQRGIGLDGLSVLISNSYSRGGKGVGKGISWEVGEETIRYSNGGKGGVEEKCESSKSPFYNSLSWMQCSYNS